MSTIQKMCIFCLFKILEDQTKKKNSLELNTKSILLISRRVLNKITKFFNQYILRREKLEKILLWFASFLVLLYFIELLFLFNFSLFFLS